MVLLFGQLFEVFVVFILLLLLPDGYLEQKIKVLIDIEPFFFKKNLPLYINVITTLFELTPCRKASIRLRHITFSICLYFVDIIIV